MTHRPLDILFVSEQPPWPLDQGFKVHGYHMAAALAGIGKRVGVASVAPLPGDAPAALREMWVGLEDAGSARLRVAAERGGGVMGAARRRVCRYLVDDPRCVARVVDLVDAHRPHTVIGLGIHAPILLHAVRAARPVRCVWYGADELVRFHASCIRREGVRRWPGRLRDMAVHAAMQRLFVPGLDGVIGVSPTDTRLFRLLAGAKRAVTIRNGVDLERFRPSRCVAPRPRSLVFWGRLDFEPNADAVLWFARQVWPALRARHADATWRIVGGGAGSAVRALAATPGVELVGYVEDVREAAWSRAVTVLPMRCGGGIKNKLLEAAAMGRPIVASPRAVRGLDFGCEAPPVMLCRDAGRWVETVERLWETPAETDALGARARRWVEHYHDWRFAARALQGWLTSIPKRPQNVVIERERDDVAFSDTDAIPLRRAA